MSTFSQISPEALSDNTIKLIGKEWMLVTAKSDNKVNTMTASWGGLGVMWGKPVAFVVIRSSRYTKEFIDQEESFSLSFFGNAYKKHLGYLGTVSGRDEDKIAKSGLTVVEDEVPYFEEARLVLKVKTLYAQEMKKDCFLNQEYCEKWYPNENYHTLYVAEITEALTK
ncbi:MAG: flavin reductase [bacterium]|nr:flavin reductase [bacterium]